MQRISSFFEWWKQGACVNYDAVLFDIDGTLILGRGNPMPGAPEVLDYLHGHRLPFRLAARKKMQFCHGGGNQGYAGGGHQLFPCSERSHA